jgi:hypothetical protein
MWEREDKPESSMRKLIDWIGAGVSVVVAAVGLILVLLFSAWFAYHYIRERMESHSMEPAGGHYRLRNDPQLQPDPPNLGPNLPPK